MATTQQIIAQNNTNAPQVATANPQANVSNVQPGIAPVTIPVQIQPVVGGQIQQQQVQQPQQQQVQQPQQNIAQQIGQVQIPKAVQQMTQPNTNAYSLFPQVNVPNEDVSGMDTYKSQYSDAINQIANSILNMRFSYNPEEDDLLQQATNYVTQNTYESMNSKGILNSSMTAERVAKVVGDLIPQYEKMAREEFEASFSRMINMANLIMNMDDRSFGIWKDARDQRWKEQEAEYEKKQKEIQNAWNKVDQLGYVDNESALLLNIPAGTLSKDAREKKEAFEREVQEWTRRHKIETETEKELIKLKEELAADEWTRQFNLEQEAKKQMLEYQDDIQARQEARQYKYDTGLLDYKNQIAQQQEQRQQQLDKELLQVKADIQEAKDQKDTEREKELLKYKAELQKEQNEIEHNYDLELLNAKSETSSANYVSLSNYDSIIKNRFATKQNGQYVVSDPTALMNYLKQEYESGRLSQNDALTLIDKYGLAGVSSGSSNGSYSTQNGTRRAYYIASTGESGYGPAY